MNTKQISKIPITPDVVDCIVFWSKNPLPMLEHLQEINQYKFYFQFSLNGYGRDIERNVPDFEHRIETFQKLSSLIGRDGVVWRYDPIFINEHFNIKWHTSCFNHIAEKLRDYTDQCVISFVDMYPRIKPNVKGLNVNVPQKTDIEHIASSFSRIAQSNGIILSSCSEDIDLSHYGIDHASCIDKKRIEKILGRRIAIQKDKTQRSICGCVSSIDIGAYNTCQHGCAYCYANHSPAMVQRNGALHNPDSPLLFGEVSESDRICERKVSSLKSVEPTLFER